MKKLLIATLAVASLSLAACATDGVTVDSVKIPAAQAPEPAPLTMRNVQWKILTKADLEKLLAELEANPDPNFALYTLDNGNFQALNLNLVEIRRFIVDQQQVIVFYKNLENPTPPAEEKKEEPKKKRFGLF